MWEKFSRIWKVKDVRNNVLIVLGLLVITRLVAHIPIPGVNVENLKAYLAGNQILGLLNVLSGGTMQTFSIVMLAVGPYITASIIFQLLTMIVPSLEELSKEGESGQQRINMYTRWLTVPLSFLQAYAMIKLLNNSSQAVLMNLTPIRIITIIMTVTAGTMFLVWIGELITERKVGNGTSLIIFAGIISGIPAAVRNVALNYDPSQFYSYVLFIFAALLTVVGVVFISEGQRDIPVSYAKQVRGSKVFGGTTSHLPFRVNMAGVIPIIFAVSIMLFPSMISQFFVNANSAFLRNAATGTIRLFQNGTFYNVVYFLLIFGFTYFYTSVVFQPQKIAENLQKQGGFIPGIRPGKETENYLAQTMNRINLAGAIFLGVIAILPLLAKGGLGTSSMRIGGTSLLIVVAVAIETAKQIQSQMTMHEYDTI
ncbi:MAG: preprotein translocase subunit SecY [Patescibacteria group bacterium]|jgi:preprotein translocase subunit SecY